MGSLRELLLRFDFQLFHDPLTLRRNEIGGASELFGDLFVRFLLGEAPQQLPLLRRQIELVIARRSYSLLQYFAPRTKDDESRHRDEAVTASSRSRTQHSVHQKGRNR